MKRSKEMTLENLDKLKEINNKNEFLKLLPELESDGSKYVKVLFEFVNFLTQSKDYETIVNVLEYPLKNDFIQNREDRLEILNKLLGILLKIEDFYKLKSVLDLRRDLLVKDNDFLMQDFYLAVCYEGLERYDLAIETLESIKDNISNANLVNKYLKLSMLSLKVNKLLKAEEYYKLALYFDKAKKNTAFLLAECDLLIAKKNYLKALEIYEDYYIKTKNKYRYLDRYINIQMALNQEAEAYSFYKKHFDIMTKVLSKQSKLQFFEAALKLVKRLDNKTEEAVLEGLIKEIKSSLGGFTDNSSLLIKLIDEFYSMTFLQERDVFRAVFKSLDEVNVFSKMVYVNLDSKRVNIKHFSKGLLLEKVIDSLENDKNVYKEISDFKYREIYVKDHLKSFSNDPYLSDKTQNIFVKEIDEFSYLVFYYEGFDHFNTKKLFDLVGVLIKKIVLDIKRFSGKIRLLESLLNVLNQENYCVFALRNNNLEILNQEGKRLLGIDKEYISIEEFQNLLVKNIYVDELLKKDEVVLKIENNGISLVRFIVYKDEFDIYLVGKKEETQVKKRKYQEFSDLKMRVVKAESSLILINLRGYHELFKDYSLRRYSDLLDRMYEVIKLSSRNYFQEVFIEGLDNIYLLVSTKDKRIISRIIDDLFNEFKENIDIRSSSVNLKNEVDDEVIEDLMYLVSLTSLEMKYIADSKSFRTNREVARTIKLNIEKILSEGNIKLSYQLIVNWLNDSFKYVYVDVLNRVLLGNKPSLKRVIEANNLTGEWDNLMIGQLIKDVRLAQINAKFILEVSLKTLADKDELAKLKKKLAVKAFSNSDIYYLIDFEDYLKFKPALNFEQIIFRNVLKAVKLSEIDVLKRIKHLLITDEEINQEAGKLLLKIAKENLSEIIYDHQKSDLLKSFLVNNNIELVMGESFARFDQLKNIRK